MKIKCIHIFVLMALLNGCRPKVDCDQIISRMNDALSSGNFSGLQQMEDSVRKSCPAGYSMIEKADSLNEIARRILLDFSLGNDKVEEKMKSGAGPFSEDDKKKWEEKGWLEYRIIDGKKRYFKRAASNLVLLREFYEPDKQKAASPAEDPESTARLKHTTDVLKFEGTGNDTVFPVRINVTYTITVHPDAVPSGETVRCWMPWPKSDHSRQVNIRLLETSEKKYSISPDTAVHSTLYMERKASSGTPVTFSVSYSYTSHAQYFSTSGMKALPYNTRSEIYRKYTSEQLPQIRFSNEIRHLADSLAGDEKNPVAVAHRFYMWFKENIPWAGALEYSIMPDIPGYVLKNRHGDCGMQTMLYMSMLRYKGIPVRWQSGWMVPPSYENLHDWSEIYFEGTGWIPSDVSYSLQNSDKRELREFYFSGLDSYRLIINDGISGNLYPSKKFIRSEPYDFQRGEVEWSGGNLYFDKWDYDMKLEYDKP